MKNDETWYTDMADAIKARDKAISMVERWQTAKAEAEAEIESLRIQQQQQQQQPATEPAPAPEED